MVFRQILAFGQRRPFAFQLGVATVKTAAADLLVQRYVEGKTEIDWKRNAVFTVFGGAYLGGFQWLIYVTAFRRWFPNMDKFAAQTLKQKMANRPGQIDLMKQVTFDNFVHYTFIYFPVFYVFKESIQQNEETSGPMGVVTGAMEKYSTNFWGDNLAIWALWIPADIIIYAIPIWMRLPANHGISFVWTCILSAMRGAKIEEDPEEEEAKVELIAE